MNPLYKSTLLMIGFNLMLLLPTLTADTPWWWNTLLWLWLFVLLGFLSLIWFAEHEAKQDVDRW